MPRTRVPDGVNFITWTLPTLGIFPMPKKQIKYGFYAGWSMIGVMWIIRLSTRGLDFWQNINYEYLVATWIGLPMLPTNFLTGMFLHNFIGSIFAFGYAYLFEKVFGRVSGQIGIYIGLCHAVLFGVVLLALPYVHPAIPELIPAPGIWYSNLGVGGVFCWFATHTMFGFLMGYQHRRMVMGRDYPKQTAAVAE